MRKDSRIFVAGHRGLVGSAVVRRLRSEGYSSIVVRSRAELDLLDQTAVHRFFREAKVEYAIIAAARVGGIFANSTQQAEFLYENLVIATNTIHAAFESGVEKLLYLGSSCIYPRMAPQPMREDALLTGPLEPTNEGYALAKIAGLKLCEHYHRQYGRRFISAMPTNLYGAHDNFHPTRSHVIPGMMRRFHEAKVADAREVTVWGSGTPKREFLHVDDLASAIQQLMLVYEEESTINVGSGEEVSIAELASMMKRTTGFAGTIRFDTSKPDGSPRKMLDSSRMFALGWRPSVSLQHGLQRTYAWALESGVFSPEAQPVG